MQVIRACVMGYCMGVKRAVDIATKSLSQYKGSTVYSLGPLIHNDIALNLLKQQGLHILNDVPNMNIHKSNSNQVVIIRAHGVSPVIKEMLMTNGYKVIDATCPRVALSHKRVRDFALKGYKIYIAGDKNHGEVQGIAGASINSTGDNVCTIISSKEDAINIISSNEPSLLLSQTTILPQEYEVIKTILKQKLSCLQVIDSICPSTLERQNALKNMVGLAEGVLVIGGKNSANTHRLFLLAKTLFPMACHIESVLDIPEEYFTMDSVALTAGASTPNNIIDDIEKYLLKNAIH